MEQKNESFDSIREELKRLIDQSEKKNLSDSTDLSECIQSFSRTMNTVDLGSIEKLDNTKSRKNKTFIDATVSYSIDDDIQKMRSELQKSYKLFQTAGEAFVSINFNCLKHRISDLHLSASQSEIDTVIQKKTVNDSLDQLTDIMGNKFRQHPGEFGDIPELSSFFKACSQLQHGLKELKRYRGEMDELGQRMNWATDISNQRTEEIQKAIQNQKK